MLKGSSLFNSIVIIIWGVELVSINNGIEKEKNTITVCLEIQEFELTTKLLCTYIAKIMERDTLESFTSNYLILRRKNECYSEKCKCSGICC